MAKIRHAISLADLRPFTFKMKMATLFSAFTLVMQLLGVVTSSWVKVTGEGYFSIFGLWQGCVKYQEDVNLTCVSYVNLESDWKANCWNISDVIDDVHNANRDVIDELENLCTVLETLKQQPWRQDWFQVLRVLEVIGVGGVILAVFVTLLSLVYADLRLRCTSIVVIVVCFVSAAVIFTGGILIILSTDERPVKAEAQPSWSLDVSMLSAILAMVTGSIVIIDIKEDACINLYEEDEYT